MGRQSVQCRSRYHRAAQRLSPVGEAFVLRQHDAATLVPRGHQAEERSCGLPVVRSDAASTISATQFSRTSDTLTSMYSV